ncbi:unnamed protein product [Linum tenue]|uniref:[Histone H3]-lysine(27) N-trimethyltransferase n=1 Tax=Linum tenue TaxID=586396 RepID=A0AAV0PES0_9ROSI|nr:unnamed protein product [Linum tenue]
MANRPSVINSLEHPTGSDSGNLMQKLNQLRKEIQAERMVSVREKVEKNRKKLEMDFPKLESATSSHTGQPEGDKMISRRIGEPMWEYSGFAQGSGDRDNCKCQEVLHGRSTKLPYVEKIPPYTTWIFLDRNQKMTEDQSVVGRRRIYYEQDGGEALVCSDSEEEIVEPEEDKRCFSEAEDRIIWSIFQEDGLADSDIDLVSQFIGASAMEIRERCSVLQERHADDLNVTNTGDSGPVRGFSLEKTLSAALDSFDNLFCRRCLVFDCRLHGCSQTLINPSERHSYWSEYEDDRKPCGDQCCLRERVKDFPEHSTDIEVREKSLVALHARLSGDIDSGTEVVESQRSMYDKGVVVPSETACDSDPECQTRHADASDIVTGIDHTKKRKALHQTGARAAGSTLVPSDVHDSSCKKQKGLVAADIVSESEAGVPSLGHDSSTKSATDRTADNPDCGSAECTSIDIVHIDREKDDEAVRLEVTDVLGRNQPFSPVNCTGAEIDAAGVKHHQVNDAPESSQSVSKSSEWRALEKELYLKGVEIFGKNSCLIARNMLSGLKTCIEVSKYMCGSGTMVPRRSLTPSSFSEDNGMTDADHMEMPARPRLLRRRGRTRKFKYSWKSAGHPSMWKRMADGKNQSCKQYTPCGCQSMCGKLCPCLENGTCCEKYCGCSKSCKNRFRGCHCAKSQCRSRQCPCFAAGRECDPDVCRNCWVSCGDGSLGEPLKRGDGQCGNMRLLLHQQQRIMLAKSDVAGWGAFLKNAVNRNDYLGEYTGELISHREADKRGKIYDRANSSFLFDLNDQFVLDAYRKGDKLKFANHSSNPNCYAKVMLVAGDHRVGIFAKEHIDAREELFYDYRYGPDQAPAWARKPERDYPNPAGIQGGRAKKHHSSS